MTRAHNSDELLQERYVVLLLRAARRLDVAGERFLSGFGLTMAQFNVLNLVGSRDGMPQFDLARALVVGKATISSVIGGLMKRRLVRLSSDPHDRRANLISLTPAGKTLWKRAHKAYLDVLRQSLPSVTAKELAALDTALLPLSYIADDIVGTLD